MTKTQKAERLFEKLFGWPVMVADKSSLMGAMTIDRVLEECRFRGLRPTIGLHVKPGTSSVGDAWRGTICRADGGVEVGTSDSSAFDALAEAILRYYGAWEETT